MTKFELQPSCLVWRDVPDLQDYQELGNKLCNMQRSIPWWIGDWFVGGESQFGDDFYQAVDETFSLDLLNRYGRVIREFKRSERFATLSWTHHQIAANLQHNLRQALLSRAEREGWNTQQFRSFVRDLE